MTITPIDNNPIRYVARMTYRGRAIKEIAYSRERAIRQACTRIEKIDKEKLLKAGYFCPEHGYIAPDQIDPCDIPW